MYIWARIEWFTFYLSAAIKWNKEIENANGIDMQTWQWEHCRWFAYEFIDWWQNPISLENFNDWKLTEFSWRKIKITSSYVFKMSTNPPSGFRWYSRCCPIEHAQKAIELIVCLTRVEARMKKSKLSGKCRLAIDSSVMKSVARNENNKVTHLEHNEQFTSEQRRHQLNINSHKFALIISLLNSFHNSALGITIKGFTHLRCLCSQCVYYARFIYIILIAWFFEWAVG